ncbi:MAG: hypothetical protein ACT4PV_10410 [Planctomycetaceae bacterium]
MEVAALRLTWIVIALNGRKRATGAWPESLDGLFGAGTPQDPVASASFAYARGEEGVRIHAAPPRRLSATDWEALEECDLAWSFPP